MTKGKFHISTNGDPAPCDAKIRCRLGGESGEENHYATAEEARSAFEKSQGINARKVSSYRIPNKKRQELRKSILKHSSKVVALGASAVLAATLTGCAPSEYSQVEADYVKVCQQVDTQERVEDMSCESTGLNANSSVANGAFMWYYLASQLNNKTSVPAVGSKLSGGVTSIPAGATSVGFNTKGGTMGKASASTVKGGFGSGGKSGGGAGG